MDTARPSPVSEKPRQRRRMQALLGCLALAIVFPALAQQFDPPTPHTIDQDPGADSKVLVTLPADVLFRGTRLDAATRTEILANLRNVRARDLAIERVDPDRAAQWVPPGTAVLPEELTGEFAQQWRPPPGDGMPVADPCALPQISEAEVEAIGRLLHQHFLRTGDDAEAFLQHTPADCPLDRLRYYTQSALLVQPVP